MTPVSPQARLAHRNADPWQSLRSELQGTVAEERIRLSRRRRLVRAVRPARLRPLGAGRTYWFVLLAAVITLAFTH